MKKNYRQGRLSEEIKKIISNMLYTELKDPRFATGMISISEVKASPDGSYATVYVSILGKDTNEPATKQEKDDVIEAFRSAKGLIRKEIGSKMELRHTPDLNFKIDTSEEYGMHIEKLIDELGIKDD